MRILQTQLFTRAVEMQLQHSKRFPLLGIDYGVRRIGLALSDPGCNIAMPLRILSTPKGIAFRSVAESIESTMATHKIGGLVVGWPLMELGQIGDQCHRVEDFLEKLSHFDVIPDDMPITLWDERHSSNMVMENLRMAQQEDFQKQFKEGRQNRKRVKKKAQSVLKLPKSESLDHEVAAYILQEYLDSSGLSGGTATF